MKTLIGIVLGCSFIFSLDASAQSSSTGLTRAQVRADLAQYEQAGYDPTDWMNYPENIRAARAKIEAKNAAKKESK